MPTRPEKYEYPINRYTMEVKRQMDVLDRRLADNRYLAGDEYTIADMATWPWYGQLTTGRLYDSGKFLQVDDYANVVRWYRELKDREGVKRGWVVNNPFMKKDRRHPAAGTPQRRRHRQSAGGTGGARRVNRRRVTRPADPA